MNADEFAKFWATQHHRVISTESCFWYNTEPFVFLSLPFHRIVEPSRKEILRILWQGPALVVRHAAPAQESECNGGLYVCGDRDYDIPSLTEKARNRTRRGLKCCRVERIEFSDLIELGYQIDIQTYIRQERDPHGISRGKWTRYCTAAGKTTGFEAWGAFIDKELAAYAVCALIEDYYHILRQGSATDYLNQGPNNALTFTVTQQAIGRSDVKYVSTGLKSIEETGGLDRYKLGMGYHLQPFQDRLIINPIVRSLFKVGGAKAIRKLHDRDPSVDFWRKAARTLDLIHQALG